jgi:hypothetical protein
MPPFDNWRQKTILYQPVTVNATHLPNLKDVLPVLLKLAENFQRSGEFFIWSGQPSVPLHVYYDVRLQVYYAVIAQVYS